jgi:hypothetical protein
MIKSIVLIVHLEPAKQLDPVNSYSNLKFILIFQAGLFDKAYRSINRCATDL